MSLIYSANNVAVTGPQSMYQLKALLAGVGTNTSQGSPGGGGTAGFTTVASSDGTSFNTAGSGIDYWQSGSSGTKGCANNSAWWVGQMPTANGFLRQVLIQRGLSNTSWRIGISTTSGFTGAGNGAISATVAPTAADGQALAGTLFGVATGTPAFSTSFFAADSTYAFSCAADAASPYGLWMFALSGTSTVTAFIVDPLVAGSYPAADTDPYVYYCAASSSTALQQSGDLGGAAAISSSNLHCNLKYGLAGAGWVQTGAGIWLMNNASIANKNATTLGVNSADGNDIPLPIYYGRVASLAAPVGGKGISSLLKSTVNALALKATISIASAGAKDKIVVNDVVFDWNGSVPS